jgi:hypothetical protein
VLREGDPVTIKNAAVKQRGTFRKRAGKIPGRQTHSTDQPSQLTSTDGPRCLTCGYREIECSCAYGNPTRYLWFKLSRLIKLGEAAKLLDDHHTQLRVSSEDVDVRLDSHHWHQFIVAVRKYREK